MGEPMRVLPSPSPSPPTSAGRKRRPLSTSALSTSALSTPPAASMTPSAADVSPGASTKLEQLLINHMRFAQAVKKNDTALLVPFLARDVSMRTLDGARLQGQSAVLAHLVGARMSKLSANLHVKGCPARTGAAQSSFVYEHGLLFKDPLFIEVLDWRATGTIAAIAHVPLPDATTNKAFQDFVKASDKLRRRAARDLNSARRSVSSDLSDDDSSRSSSASVKPDDDQDSEPDVRTPSQPEEEAVSQRDGCRFSCASKTVAMLEAARSVESAAAASSASSSLIVPTRPRQRLSSGDSTSSSSVEASAPASPFDDDAPVFILAELAVVTELTPIRKRKVVNPFVVLHCVSTGAVWKSPVRKRQRSPRWTDIPLSFPVRSTSDVLEVELWDQAFLRATKVAATTVLVSQLLKGELAYLASVDMPRAEFADKGTAAAQLDEKPTIQLQLDFRRRLKMDRSSLFETHISSGDEDEDEVIGGAEPARRPSTGQDTSDQLVAGSSIGVALCEHMGVSLAVLVTLLAWMLFYFKMYVVQEAAQQ